VPGPIRAEPGQPSAYLRLAAMLLPELYGADDAEEVSAEELADGMAVLAELQRGFD
jgi:hypothetical protein